MRRRPWGAYTDDLRKVLGAPVMIGMDLASGPDATVYACREHINTPHPACPTCAEVGRRSAVPQGTGRANQA